MASGISSPQCILQTSASSSGFSYQADGAKVCNMKKNVGQLGYNSSIIFNASLTRVVHSVQYWHYGNGIQRQVFVRGADRSKSGFGPQPVKKNKKRDRPQPKKENDPITQAQQILAGKQQDNDISASTVIEQAPALDLEKTEEKMIVGNEQLFEERLAEIKRKAAEQKALEEQKNYLPIDYDAPPPTAPTEAKWTDSLAARIGAVVAVVVFGAIFALGDFLPSGSPSRGSGNQIEQKQLPPEEEAKLKAQAEKFEEALKFSPEDRDALEGAGVTYAELGEYSKSATYLTKLVQKSPNNAEAQRLLGEVLYESDDYAGSATAYRSALRASPKESIGLLQGLIISLLAENKPSEAVGELLAARARLNEMIRPQASLQQGSTSAKEKGADSTQTDDTVDPVQVEMLLGKVYASWSGHSGDAVAVYDGLIATHPNDFRGYLAKGILLKDQGRAGDAERMFIQARYLAPLRAKSLVDKYSGR